MDNFFDELPFNNSPIYSNRELSEMEQKEKIRVDRTMNIQQKKLTEKQKQHELLLLAKQNYNKLKYEEHVIRQLKRERKQLRRKIDREVSIKIGIQKVEK